MESLQDGLSIWLSKPLLEIYPKEVNTHFYKNLDTWLFTQMLFLIVKNQTVQ